MPFSSFGYLNFRRFAQYPLKTGPGVKNGALNPGIESCEVITAKNLHTRTCHERDVSLPNM